MVNCDLWEVGPALKEEWKSASTMSGALCVMTFGGPVMQWLPALSLASCLRVSEKNFCKLFVEAKERQDMTLTSIRSKYKVYSVMPTNLLCIVLQSKYFQCFVHQLINIALFLR